MALQTLSIHDRADTNRRYRARLRGEEAPLLTAPRWTPEQDQIIRDWYSDEAKRAPRFRERLAAELGRTVVAVSLRASRLGLGDRGRKVPKQYRYVKPRKYATEEERRTAIVARLKANHPRGSLGLKHTPETLAKISAKVLAACADPTSVFHSEEFRQRRADSSARAAANRVQYSKEELYSRAARGRREDLDNRFFRSRWEANYARYLNWLKTHGEIHDWEYECHTFWFEKIRRGVRSYTPDFKVWKTAETYEWHEVKGWMDPKSITKLKRMAKYYPKEKLVVIDNDFFSHVNRTHLFRLISEHWEHKSR